MAEPNEDKATVEKLQEQITNLERGIASERDQRQTAEKNFATLRSELDELKKKSEGKDPGEKADDQPQDLEEKLEDWARKKGFVTAEERDAERQRLAAEALKSIETEAVAEFIEKHPEADSDEVWGKVQAEFQLYKQPTTKQAYRALLAKVWKDVSGSSDKAREEGKAAAKAEAATKSRLALGGGSQSTESDDVEDIESLQKRYPNLSKDQIRSMKADTDEVIKEKESKRKKN